MDLNKLVQKESGTLVLLHPTTHLPTDITIDLAGADSDTFQQAKHKIANKRMERAQKVGVGKYRVTAEELDEESLQVLAACTKGWMNIQVDGKDLAFSTAAALTLYREQRWIRDQVDSFVGDRESFFGS